MNPGHNKQKSTDHANHEDDMVSGNNPFNNATVFLPQGPGPPTL